MFLRMIILLVGPIVLTGGTYMLTVGRGEARREAARTATAESSQFDIDALHAGAEAGLTPEDSATSSTSDTVRLSCDTRARILRGHLQDTDRLIVRPPFILAGDLPEAELDHHYRQTVLPTVRALSLMYFDHEPSEAITLLMYSSEDSYRTAALRLDRDRMADYYGYYVRNDRRIVVNISTGAGTLAHELTHAMSHFDFPHMPEWFDEGLTSVYEEADFTDDGLQLNGLSNWRLNHLLNAIQQQRLATLESLVSARDMRAGQQEIDYAHARYFCLYLQQRNLLPFFYRRFRSKAASDPSGLRTLCTIFDRDTLDPIDRDFRRWVIRLYQDSQVADAS